MGEVSRFLVAWARRRNSVLIWSKSVPGDVDFTEDGRRLVVADGIGIVKEGLGISSRTTWLAEFAEIGVSVPLGSLCSGEILDDEDRRGSGTLDAWIFATEGTTGAVDSCDSSFC